MEALYLLIGCSLPVALGFLVAFLWAVKNGQYDDTVTPAIRMLFENTPTKTDTSIKPTSNAQPPIDSYE